MSMSDFFQRRFYLLYDIQRMCSVLNGCISLSLISAVWHYVGIFAYYRFTYLGEIKSRLNIQKWFSVSVYCVIVGINSPIHLTVVCCRT